MARESSAVQFRIRITKGDDIAIGPGKVDLLEAIGATGSITAAAKRLGMSRPRPAAAAAAARASRRPGAKSSGSIAQSSGSRSAQPRATSRR